MHWTSVFVYLSAAVLVAAVVGEVAGWPGAWVQWLLLAWSILLLPLCAALFRHPMRAPAWGLFIGFWATLGVLTLIVLQSLAVAGVLRQPSRTFAESWPLAVLGLWLLVASTLGAAREVEGGYAVPVLAVGALAGLALIATGVIVWAGVGGAERGSFFAAAVLYVVWAAGLSGELWARPSAPPTRPAPAPAGEIGLDTRPEPAAVGVSA